MRTSRSNGSTTYTYVYNGSQLTQMTKGSDTLYFTYGALGPTTVTWNGTTYYYALNAQGDVIGIFDGGGNGVVLYNWDIPAELICATFITISGEEYELQDGFFFITQEPVEWFKIGDVWYNVIE